MLSFAVSTLVVMIPFTIVVITVIVCVRAFAVTTVIAPLSFVDTATFISVCAISMFLPIFPFSFVENLTAPINVFVLFIIEPPSLLFCITPLSSVHRPVRSSVRPFSVRLPIFPHSFKRSPTIGVVTGVTYCNTQLPLPMSFVKRPLSHVSFVPSIRLDTAAVFQIVFPFSFVKTVLVDGVRALSTHLVVHPLTHVGLPIIECQRTVPVLLAILHLTLIDTPVRCNHHFASR